MRALPSRAVRTALALTLARGDLPIRGAGSYGMFASYVNRAPCLVMRALSPGEDVGRPRTSSEEAFALEKRLI